MVKYQEFPVPPDLAPSVECFWTMRHSGDGNSIHRVVPDGCADILFTKSAGESTLQVVGPMTMFADSALLPQQLLAGVRFRPGMWSEHIGAAAIEMTDRLLPLAELWKGRSNDLHNKLDEARSPEECIATLRTALNVPVPVTPLRQALRWMEREEGCVSLDDLAKHSGVSGRQFRRLCIRDAGLSPKFLARVMRFRKAAQMIYAGSGDYAGIAAACGFFDQSHLIAEFRRLSGRTPREYGVNAAERSY